LADGDKDYFFHREDFLDSWNTMLKDFRRGKVIYVEFEPSESIKGLRASEVRRKDAEE
jgi:cold shock CspA family protein